ncbi:MAG: hypothetical protein V1800_18730 [Candidatus Latescibacterota bacterium]
MASATIHSGICGFTTTVRAQLDDLGCTVTIESDCESIRRLATELIQVDPFREITFWGEGPLTLELAAKHCHHPACPVPVGIIKAIEVAAGLALPVDPVIKISRADA